MNMTHGHVHTTSRGNDIITYKRPIVIKMIRYSMRLNNEFSKNIRNIHIATNATIIVLATAHLNRIRKYLLTFLNYKQSLLSIQNVRVHRLLFPYFDDGYFPLNLATENCISLQKVFQLQVSWRSDASVFSVFIEGQAHYLHHVLFCFVQSKH